MMAPKINAEVIQNKDRSSTNKLAHDKKAPGRQLLHITVPDALKAS